jgi:hypothetical protein
MRTSGFKGWSILAISGGKRPIFLLVIKMHKTRFFYLLPWHFGQGPIVARYQACFPWRGNAMGCEFRLHAIFAKSIEQYFVKTIIFGVFSGVHNPSGCLPDCGKAE